MKHIIWTSEINLEDWKDFLQEHPEASDEYEQYQLVAELNEDYRQDEKINLNKEINGVIIADLGLWDGLHHAFKEIKNLNECLNYHTKGASVDLEVFVQNGSLKAIERHHDGINYYTFYQIKDGYTVDDLPDEALIDLGKAVQEIYGWSEL